MSLLERLGHKANKEALSRQLLDKESDGQPESESKSTPKSPLGGLSARLNANHKIAEFHQRDAIHEVKEDKHEVYSAENLDSIESVPIIKLEDTPQVAFAKSDRSDSESGSSRLDSKLELRKQDLGLASRLNNVSSSGKIGSGLSSRLGLGYQREEQTVFKRSNLGLNMVQNKDNKISGIKGKVTVELSKEVSESLALKEKKTDNQDEKKMSDVNSDDGSTVAVGLGAKLGNLGSRSGLGARLGKPLEDVKESVTSSGKSALMAKKGVSTAGSEQEQYQNLKIEIHRQIIEELSIEQQKIIANSSSDRSELEQIVIELCNKVIDGDNPMAVSRAARVNIVNDIVDEVLGLGPIESLLKDESVSEVMINGPKMVYVERKGKLTLTNVQFQDEAHLLNIIERIVAPLGRRIDESSPLVDARLADGSRVNIIIPPLALNGACVTIRKFAKDPLTINNLIGFGSLNEDMASLIKSCVLGRLNIVVSGGTGSGKTTTLNVLSSFIPEDERIVTIEDAAELQLRQDHVVTLESRPANVEGNGQVSIRDLVRNSLRMRPDRIVVGECRSGEALDMLQAMNTGHDGSLTTAHANSPRDVISRLETMVLMAGMDLPIKAIREQIASAVDLIIQQSRLRDGSRKITYITEVQGMEGDVIVLQDLFRFEQDGLDEDGKLKGEFQTSGIRPKFLEKLETNGIKVDVDMFLGNMGWNE